MDYYNYLSIRVQQQINKPMGCNNSVQNLIQPSDFIHVHHPFKSWFQENQKNINYKTLALKLNIIGPILFQKEEWTQNPFSFCSCINRPFCKQCKLRTNESGQIQNVLLCYKCANSIGYQGSISININPNDYSQFSQCQNCKKSKKWKPQKRIVKYNFQYQTNTLFKNVKQCFPNIKKLIIWCPQQYLTQKIRTCFLRWINNQQKLKILQFKINRETVEQHQKFILNIRNSISKDIQIV